MPGTSFGEIIRESGLVSDGDSGVVMVSGGADSVALLIGLTEALGPERLVVLHVNYGLRPEADGDEKLVRRLCGKLGVGCEVCRAGDPDGNLQAWAREVRHREAERIRSERELSWIAVGHNRTDQVETFLYRLATSPGVTPLLAMPPRSGRVIRPLLELGREELRLMLSGVADWVEDETNEDAAYARNRIRLEVIPGLEQVNPAAQRNITRTRSELTEDSELLGDLAEEALKGIDLGSDAELPGVLLARRHPALRRRMLRMFAESGLDRAVPISTETSDRVARLVAAPEGGEVDLGGGDRFVVESGRIRVRSSGGDEIPDPVDVPLAGGEVAFGSWTLRADLFGSREARSEFGAEWSAFFDADDLALTGLNVRTRQEGDRIEQLGMEGSRSLQDVFTNPISPRSRRSAWPVIEAAGTVVWVPGLAVSSHFLVRGHTRRVLRLHARPAFPI